MKRLSPGFRLDRYKTHDISLIIDRVTITEKNSKRIKDSVALALKKGKNEIQLIDSNNNAKILSKLLMCPDSGISLPEPEPNLFHSIHQRELVLNVMD